MAMQSPATLREMLGTDLAMRTMTIRHDRPHGPLLISRRTALGVLALLGSFAHPSRAARTLYVSVRGDDANPGTIQSPFRTIRRGLASLPQPAAHCVIVVMPGVYDEQVVVNKGGDATGYFTLRSFAKHSAKIRSPSSTYAAVNIVKDYVIVDGFDVQAGGDGHGIEATFLDGKSLNRGPHHIQVLNNTCHNNPGSGIGVAYGDFYVIESNLCYDNCQTNQFQGSGISIYAARSLEEGAVGHRNFVRGNICWRNTIRKLPGNPEPVHSDGNGIIIDDFHNSQLGHPAGNYKFGTLVENNLVYQNGGKGIHVYYSDNVLVRNNTSYRNNCDSLNPGTWRGELSNVMGSNNIWVNNIAVADPEANPANTAIGFNQTGAYRNQNVRWDRNLTFNGRPGEASLNVSENPREFARPRPGNYWGVDPMFVNTDVGLGPLDFRLRVGSPAANAGTLAFGISSGDLAGNARMVGATVDLGAYELQECGACARP